MEKQSVQINSATIIEQRKELMVSPTGSLPTLRNAHFLKPSVTSIDGPSLKLPALTPKPIWSLDVTFNGWRNPLKKWNIWLENMHSRYNTLWKETGIYDALMCSNHKIIRDNDLMFGLAERWCSETNTFFFPWGESTITLEDVLILGGFSVLGGHFLMPLQNQELIEIETFLENSSLDNWSLPKFYKEKEMWLKGKNLTGDLESFVRCLRTCLLVGIDCQEPYNSHRVAMQFGLDQDLPGWVPRVHTTPDIAWYDYSKPLSDDEILYVPCRLLESDVTTRYLDWWRKTVLCPVNPFKGLVKGRRSLRKPLLRPWKQLKFGSNQDVPPRILPARRPKKEKQRKKILLAPKVDKNTANKSMQELIVLKTANDPETPPGFPSKNGIKTTGEPLNPCIEKGVSSTMQSVENVDENEDVLKNDVKKGKSNSKARKFKTMDKLLGVPSKLSPKKQKSNSTGEPLQTRRRIRSNEKGRGENSSNLNSALVTDINARLLRLESELAVLKGKDNIWTNEPGLNNQKNKL
ncbi:hypothetical protein ACJIZ3_013108 [Penstemon smallii]|uniref:Aminotransferase-like plant mobile domain-containing protein n=1 Tax=Penstemon smallii TaxID=265156 RepID=A0ABD3UNY3_9LAMI